MTSRLRYTSLYACYELPCSIGVTPGCLGKSFTIEVASLSLKAHLPGFIWSDDQPYLQEPTMPAEVKRSLHHFTEWKEQAHRYWGSVDSWHPAKKKILRCQVGATLLTFRLPRTDISYSDYLHGRGHPQAPEITALFAEIDTWFARFGTWLEVAVDQDLNAEHPLKLVQVAGNGLHVMSLEGNVVSLPATASSIAVSVNSYENVTLPLLRRAAQMTNHSNTPDDAWLLLRDAQTAFRRGSFRRSAIDAGSAVELALADFNQTITQITTPPRGATLGWYVKQPTIAARAGLPLNLSSDVVDVRNNAIHKNRVPTREQAKIAIAETQKVLDRLRPLPI